ncbi:zinc ribbon domain-containing protein [Cesiribacter andamanensis]|uniref:Uncharacterized protein n=1 Tax=Cesiribacter andamanensis AMV16 TaxID=1279009 RepID=M7N8Z4_9BACT|nr:zinc-ribbon domain-containing protein [Cesiribacter andamanensis]EMR03722.1 hypothetical protein ADICEAN_01156 [Cesiribacter andamanensis AMV16]
MIFYGTKATPVGVYKAERLKCQNCGEDNKVQFEVYARYFHLYWIPTFPLGKVAVSTCQHCKHALDHKQFGADQQYQYAYERVKGQTSTPKWHFAGLLLICSLLTWGVISNIQSGEEQQGYIAQPQAGDVYDVKSADGYYSTLRVSAIEGDVLHLQVNEYAVNKASATHTIDKAENYSEEFMEMTQAEIAEMFEKGEITRVKR